MLKLILQLLPMLVALFLKLFRKKDKAREVLSETPIIDSVREGADKKAIAKFGRRTQKDIK